MILPFARALQNSDSRVGTWLRNDSHAAHRSPHFAELLADGPRGNLSNEVSRWIWRGYNVSPAARLHICKCSSEAAGGEKGKSTISSMRAHQCFSSFPDVELPEVIKDSKEICEPQNQNDDNHAIQNRFDLSLHGDEPVYKPQQKPNCDDCNDDGSKWHILFSDQYLALDQSTLRQRFI